MRLSEMHTPVTPQKINKVMERSFGFTIDYDNLTYPKAQRLSKALTENIRNIKKSFGAHTAEKNPKYMELMLVKEGLERWMSSEQGLFESELGQAEAKLAAQDIVKQLEDMFKKIGKIQDEQMLELTKTINDQIGAEQATQFKSAMDPLLQSLYDAIKDGINQSTQAVLTLTGEGGQPSDMSMGGMPGADQGMGAPAPAMAGPEQSDMDTDGFGAETAATGGEEELGRERRI
jgi:hypothetical protein